MDAFPRVNGPMLDRFLKKADAPLAALFARLGDRGVRARVRRMARQFPGVRFCEVLIDEEPSLASRHYVSAPPTLILFLSGREAVRHSGRDLVRVLTRLLRHSPR